MQQTAVGRTENRDLNREKSDVEFIIFSFICDLCRNDDDRGDGRYERRGLSRRNAAEGCQIADDQGMVVQAEKGLQTIMRALNKTGKE